MKKNVISSINCYSRINSWNVYEKGNCGFSHGFDQYFRPIGGHVPKNVIIIWLLAFGSIDLWFVIFNELISSEDSPKHIIHLSSN